MYNSPSNNFQSYYTADQSQSRAAALMQRVAYLLCTALLVTAGGAYMDRGLPLPTSWVFGVGALVCVFILAFTRSVPGLNLILLYVLSLLEGLFLGPLLNYIIHGFALGPQIVGEAFGITALIMAGIGSYVWITNKDFGYLGKFLFWGLLGVLVVGIVGIFWHSLFAMPGIYLLYELVVAAVFVGFTLYDFSNIKHRYGPNDYVAATVSLYLDFLNLFWAILQILLVLTGGGGNRRN
ncbi:MAG TPA: Bax inhibitor-1/YccA family protein [Capsulimonadaceae bacterium]|nr:Bax inhibitor-1/YccA family protein [Capsulimonadaceae bacterium]